MFYPPLMEPGIPLYEQRNQTTKLILEQNSVPRSQPYTPSDNHQAQHRSSCNTNFL